VGALWVGALVFGVTAFAWIPVGMLAIIRESPPAISGKTTGIILATFYLGTALAPVVLGALVDATGTFVYSWLTSAFALTIATVMVVVWHRRILRERAAEAGAAGEQAAGDQAAPAC
jgi:cyanate permease